MSAPIYFKAVSRLTGTVEYATGYHDWMLRWAQSNRDHLGLWNIVETYPDTDPITHRAVDWLRDRTPAYEPPDAPMPAFYSEVPQDSLRTALDRYNERYDNTLYLAACHSLREIADQAEYILQAVRIQDVALRLCGAENVPCVTPSGITREMVNFWHAFSSDQYDDSDDSGLPF